MSEHPLSGKSYVGKMDVHQAVEMLDQSDVHAVHEWARAMRAFEADPADEGKMRKAGSMRAALYMRLFSIFGTTPQDMKLAAEVVANVASNARVTDPRAFLDRGA